MTCPPSPRLTYVSPGGRILLGLGIFLLLDMAALFVFGWLVIGQS